MAIETMLYVATAAVLFVLGTYCIAVKRNLIKIVIGIEILTAAINLNFLALGLAISPTASVDALAQSVVIVSMVIAAAIATIALIVVINAHKLYGTLDARKLRRLRW